MILKFPDFPRGTRTWDCNLCDARNNVLLLGVGFHTAPGRFFFVSTRPEATATMKRGATLRLGPSPGPVYDELTVRECETDAEGFLHCLMDVAG